MTDQDAGGQVNLLSDVVDNDSGWVAGVAPAGDRDSPGSDGPVLHPRDSGTSLPPRRRRLWQVTLLVVVVALAVEAYAFRHRITNAFGEIKHVNPWWAGAAVAASMVSMNCFARTQQRMLHAGGVDVPFLRMAGLVYAANAINWTFPAGAALSAGYVVKRLRSWGASSSIAMFALAASGLLSSVTFVGLIATYLVLHSDGVAYGIADAGGAVLLLVLVPLAWKNSATLTHAFTSGIRVANQLVHRDRDSGIETVRRFTTELTSIRPHGTDWVAAGGFASLNWATDLFCLYASCRAVNLDHATVAVIAGSYIAGMTASSISFVPGGLGVIDVAMVLALTAGGVSSAGAPAGVVLYRLISCALPVLIGWAVWAGARQTQRHNVAAGARR